jgi:hypothetical protein
LQVVIERMGADAVPPAVTETEAGLVIVEPHPSA